jgi:hypothetical protein
VGTIDIHSNLKEKINYEGEDCITIKIRKEKKFRDLDVNHQPYMENED